MIDLTKPVQTRDGRKVRILCTDAKCGTPIIGLVDDGSGRQFIATWRNDGRENLDHDEWTDLINIPETKVIEGFVNVYERGGTLGNMYPTADAAIKQAGSAALAKGVYQRIEITGDKVKISGGTE